MNDAVDGVGTEKIVASLCGASKLYGAFTALKDVDLALRQGEVHMLVGENGAGKSTLVSLLIGTNRPDKGHIEIRGRQVEDYGPHKARDAGINAVLQDFAIAPALTVAENYFLGREVTRLGLLSRAEMRRAARAAIERLGVPLDVDAKASTLTRAEQQVLEIVRAIGGRPGVLILDEPTATLSHQETERLFTIVAQLRTQGWAILYITHRMAEVRRLGDRVTILRDGQLTGSYLLSEVGNDRIVHDMVGRELTTLYPDIPHVAGEVVLSVKDLVGRSGKVKSVTIDARSGEIVGIGGLVGCGKAELARTIFGLEQAQSGEIRCDGRMITSVTPSNMLSEGMIYLPQDRRGEALALNLSIGENISSEVLASPAYSRQGFVRHGAVRRLVADLMDRLDVRPRAPSKAVQDLSGGNQQKVVLGRALSRTRRAYIFDEPTAGVDVGARLDFYNQLKQLCADGAAVVLISSDLQELIHLSHRVYVMHDGKISAQVIGDDIREDVIVAHSFGETLNSRISVQ